MAIEIPIIDKHSAIENIYKVQFFFSLFKCIFRKFTNTNDCYRYLRFMHIRNESDNYKLPHLHLI